MHKIIQSIIMSVALSTLSLAVQQRPLPDIASDLERLAAEIRQMASMPTPGSVIVKPTDSLKAALDAAPPGTTLELSPGATYTGNFVIRKAVTLTTLELNLSDARVKLSDASLMATLVSGNGGSILDIAPGVQQVTVTKVAFGPFNGNDAITIGHADASQTLPEQQPRDIAFDQFILRGDPTFGAKRGIAVQGMNVRISRCWISDIKKVGQDSQAIGGWNGAGPITISDCYLEGAGEVVMFGGSKPTIPGLIPADVLIENNTITKNTAWRTGGWTIKNLLEFKAGRNITIRGNLMEHAWVGGQGAHALVLTPEGEPTVIVENVQFVNNIVRDVGAGVQLLGIAQIGTSKQSNEIIIRNNWFSISKAANGGTGWPLFMNRKPKDVIVENNTIETDGNQIVYQDGSPVEGFSFVGNLVPRTGLYGFTGRVADGSNQHNGFKWSEYFPGGTIARNAFGSWIKPQNLPTENLFLKTAEVTLQDGHGIGAVLNYGWR